MKFNFIFIILALILSVAHSTLAQSFHQIELKAGPLYGIRIIEKYESDLYKNYRDDKETGRWGTTAEINYFYKINSAFRIGTGIGFLQQGYQTREKWMIDPCHNSISCGFKYELYGFDMNYLKIPFRLSYASKGAFHTTIEAGVSGLFLLGSKVAWTLRRSEGETISQKMERRDNVSSLENFNWGVDVSVGVGYNLSNKTIIRLQPTFNYMLFQQENTDLRDRLYNIGRFIDENKTTRERLKSYGINLSIIKNL